MPRIVTLSGVSVFIYATDHNPPHFHAVHGEYEVLVIIETLEVLAGDLRSSELRAVLAWAKENQALLQTRWAELNSEER